jgi:hypothetical protein
VTQPVLFAVEDGEHSQVAEGGASANLDKGNSHAIEFFYEATRRGWHIYAPVFNDGVAADCVGTKPGLPSILFQNKTGTIERGRPGYGICASRGSTVKRPYARHDFDVLAAYLPDRKQFAFFTYDQVAGRKTIRYNPEIHFKPDNWELLDQVAAIKAQESLGVTQPMSNPLCQNLPIP